MHEQVRGTIQDASDTAAQWWLAAAAGAVGSSLGPGPNEDDDEEDTLLPAGRLHNGLVTAV
eukprot:9094642-Karenia_brevis.AAC.1